jgi:serine/threonine-protein kinase
MLVPEAGKHIAERYRLTRLLGQGGMGSVWAAHDEKLRRDVAIKLVTERISESKQALGRFEREAMSVARLRSPYITQIYDYGVEDGSPYIIMDLLEGEDLKELLAREQRLSMDQTAQVVVQVAKALHAAHATGIVHRDLKPANVFVATEHGEQVCKVVDFGVAKALNDLADDSDTTAEGALLGTPRYMSPEQAHGAKRVDHRTDLWSLGVIAYLCLTGRLPFVAVGTGHVLVKICTEEPPSPSQINEALSPEVDAFMLQALAKDPEERFQSAREMGTAFAELADQSLSAFGASSPAWEGLPQGRLSSPSVSGERSAPSLDDISAADHSLDTSMPDISLQMGGALSQGDSRGDGTLGPAVTTAPHKPWLRTRQARLGAGAFALLAVGILGGVVLTRSSGTTHAPPAATGVVPPMQQPSSGVASASSATETKTVVPESSTSSEAKIEPSASTKSGPRRAPAPARAQAKPSSAPEAKPEPKPEPVTKPKPKPKGDGLDLFDKRF